MEQRLVEYVIEMSDMGFGLTRIDIMHLAYQIAEKGGIDHPFRSGLAGRTWFDGFRKRHPTLTLHSPQSLSYLRAKAGNPKILEDFFAKLGSIYACLNLLTNIISIIGNILVLLFISLIILLPFLQLHGQMQVDYNKSIFLFFIFLYSSSS